MSSKESSEAERGRTVNTESGLFLRQAQEFTTNLPEFKKPTIKLTIKIKSADSHHAGGDFNVRQTLFCFAPNQPCR